MQMSTYQKATYNKSAIETARPGRILLTLYDAAIRFVQLAEQQIEMGNIAGKGISIGKAHAIVSEFINALDFERSPSLCTNLELIYGFMLGQLAEANANMDTKPLKPVLRHLKELRETWSLAVSQTPADQPTETSTANVMR